VRGGEPRDAELATSPLMGRMFAPTTSRFTTRA
jgi:hypothetical protein